VGSNWTPLGKRSIGGLVLGGFPQLGRSVKAREERKKSFVCSGSGSLVESDTSGEGSEFITAPYTGTVNQSIGEKRGGEKKGGGKEGRVKTARLTLPLVITYAHVKKMPPSETVPVLYRPIGEGQRKKEKGKKSRSGTTVVVRIHLPFTADKGISQKRGEKLQSRRWASCF